MPTEEQAVQLLEELGLTEYEARCFVALSRVQKATAKEVSDLSEVPRSRVYDAVDRLHRRGLVDVQQSDPREYQAIPTDAALDVLRESYTSTIDAAGEALDGLRRSEDLEESGAWAIADHDHVTDRIDRQLETANEEVYLLVADEEMMEQTLHDRLAAVADQGVTVLVEVPSEEARAEIQERVPDAVVVETELASNPAELESKWLGRIVMVDRKAVVLSAVTENAVPGQTTETAIWADGVDHGLVVGLRHLLGARIDNPDVFQSIDS